MSRFQICGRSVWAEFGQLWLGFFTPLGQLSNRRWDIRLGSKLSDHLLDLSLGLVRRTLEKHLSIVLIYVTGKNSNTAQMKTPVGEHLEKHQVLSGRTCRLDTKVGFVLGQMQNVASVSEHG